MKKLLLSLTAVVVGFAAFGQGSVVVAGVSPAAIQGNYEFSTQANCGSWPGETDDGTWGVINNLDFNVAGTFIPGFLFALAIENIDSAVVSILNSFTPQTVRLKGLDILMCIDRKLQ